MTNKAIHWTAAIALITFVVITAIGLPIFAAEDDDDDDDLRPGIVNPIPPSHLSLFRDDELYWSYHVQDDSWYCHEKAPITDDSLEHWDDETTEFAAGQQWGTSKSNRFFVTASGRIVSYDRDDVAMAYFTVDDNATVRLSTDGVMEEQFVKLPATDQLGRTLDLAVGDLDFWVDENEEGAQYHDEMVVVYSYDRGTGSGMDFRIDVLDHNLQTIASDWSAAEKEVGAFVATDVGDFDGDGILEIAVAHSGGQWTNKINIMIYKFEINEDSVQVTHHFLEPVEISIQSHCVALDLTAGDFDGDFKDEIFVTYHNYDAYKVKGAIVELDEENELSMPFSGVVLTDRIPSHYNTLRTTSGLFAFDEDHPSVFTRQIAVCLNDLRMGRGLYCEFFDPIEMTELQSLGHYHRALHTWGTLEISAGNFIGHGVDPDNNPQTLPVEQLAVASSYSPGDQYWDVELDIIDPLMDPAPDCVYHEKHPFTLPGNFPLPVTVVAYDRDGDSWQLGRPARIVAPSNLQVDYVLQEPPKHVDYLPTNPDDPEDQWKWDVVNVGGYMDFKVVFADKEGTSTTNKTSSTSSTTTGAGVDIDVKASVKKNFGVDIVKTEFGAESDTKMNWEWSSKESSYNSQYHERTSTYTASASLDDTLHGAYTTYDIWRFPILGLETDDPDNPYTFYEVVLPGLHADRFTGGGMNMPSLYQPAHENHNIFSYPQFTGDHSDKWLPPDLGSYLIPDPDNPDQEKEVTDIMNDGATYFWDANPYSIDIEWTDEAEEGAEREWDKSFGISEDLTTYANFEFFLKAKVSVSTTGSYSKNTSLGGTTTSQSKNSSSKGLKIDIPGGENPDKSYAFKSAVYVSSNNGTFKVTHAVNPLGSESSAGWWRSQYGRKPDPALNLPNRMEHHGAAGVDPEHWTLRDVDDSIRKQMRGVWLRNSEKNPASGEYDRLNRPMHDGETVQLCARVYNYSLTKPTGRFQVKFYYQTWDKEENHPIGDLQTQDAMTTYVDNLYGVQDINNPNKAMQEVCVPFDTTGLSQPDLNIVYRFFVNLDEPDDVDEIHEFKDANGNEIAHGNNSGYWPWSGGLPILQADDSSELKSDEDMLNYRHLWLEDDALSIDAGEGLVSEGSEELYTDETYDLRVHIRTLNSRDYTHHVMFYDGDPEFGGELIAIEPLVGLQGTHNYAWTTWTPMEAGEYDLFVRVLEDHKDPVPGDAWDTPVSYTHLTLPTN